MALREYVGRAQRHAHRSRACSQIHGGTPPSVGELLLCACTGRQGSADAGRASAAASEPHVLPFAADSTCLRLLGAPAQESATRDWEVVRLKCRNAYHPRNRFWRARGDAVEKVRAMHISMFPVLSWWDSSRFWTNRCEALRSGWASAGRALWLAVCCLRGRCRGRAGVGVRGRLAECVESQRAR